MHKIFTIWPLTENVLLTLILDQWLPKLQSKGVDDRWQDLFNNNHEMLAPRPPPTNYGLTNLAFLERNDLF